MLSEHLRVTRLGIDRAAARLIDSDDPIAVVAAECGFYDQANLTRQFGRLAGETPARFRAAHSGSTDGTGRHWLR